MNTCTIKRIAFQNTLKKKNNNFQSFLYMPTFLPNLRLSLHIMDKVYHNVTSVSESASYVNYKLKHKYPLIFIHIIYSIHYSCNKHLIRLSTL